MTDDDLQMTKDELLGAVALIALGLTPWIAMILIGMEG